MSKVVDIHPGSGFCKCGLTLFQFATDLQPIDLIDPKMSPVCEINKLFQWLASNRESEGWVFESLWDHHFNSRSICCAAILKLAWRWFAIVVAGDVLVNRVAGIGTAEIFRAA